MYDTIQKTIIAWAFNHYIAYYYFDNVNVSQLKVAFEKGEIELENLPIKKDALSHLGIPWDVVSGIVGKLSIKIPLLAPLTEPWLIKLVDLMLVVSPRSQPAVTSSDDDNGDQSHLEILQDNSDSNIQEYLENSNTEREKENIINSEETKLAEFYSSFSATVSSIVKDIHRNIRLEIESMTLLFENFSHGLVKFSADSLLLHRPNSIRNLRMNNVSVYLSSIGSHTWGKRDDLLRIRLNDCNLELCDVSNNGNHTSLEINSENDIAGDLYFVGSMGNSSIPLCDFLLEDFRMLYFSGENQQDGSVFGRLSCCHFNREESSWDKFLKPWPFNLSWDRRKQHKKFSLTSDELAELNLSGALLDLIDVVTKRILTNTMQPRSWPISRNTVSVTQPETQELNSILVLRNETGHRLQFGLIDENSSLAELGQRSKSISPTMGFSGDTIAQSVFHKLSISSQSSADNDTESSSEFHRSTQWIPVENNEMVSIEPTKSILVRVEGWKTLLPIRVDKTGLFFREARSDRVKNEDTHIVISIDLEEKSARKIITIKSPLNLVNLLNTTIEILFAESNQALYIKPDSQLSVPLPYLFNRMHIRPCNVGVTTSDAPLIWDQIRESHSFESRVHICYPVTVTDKKHASYCTSHAYRICAAIQQEKPSDVDGVSYELDPTPVYTIRFMPPLTIVNLLPCELRYLVGDAKGSLAKGCQEKIYHVDITKPNDIHFELNNFPKSKAIKIDPGATGSFQQTLELIDKTNRSLYLNAKVILASLGEEPAVQVVVSAPYWIINKTKLPLIFKQEGAALEAAGQFKENEDKTNQTLLFSFYDSELEPPWLCSMRLGRSKGASTWCDGFKLEKGSGQRRLCFIPKSGDSKMNRSLVDINIRRGYGRYSDTMVVTLTTRYGFDCLAKTPKKAYESSPQDCKLFFYNYSTNLAQHIGGRSARQLFDAGQKRDGRSDISFISPGLKLVLLDNLRAKIVEISLESIAFKSATKAKEQIIDCSFQDIRIENVMPDCEKSVVLDRASALDQSLNPNPALRLIMDRMLGKSFGTVWFRQVQISMCELVLNIEEKLFLKLVEFINFRSSGKQLKSNTNFDRDLERILHPEEDRLSKYYFDLLRIDLSSLKLSVTSSTNLPGSLQKLKSCLGLKFFGFDDARVQLAPYFKMNVSQTLKGIFDSVTRFYRRQISEQAPRIVGQQIQNYLRFHLSDLLSSLYDEVYNKLFY